MTRFVRYAAAVAGVFFLLPGLWAFFFPLNFATNVATFEPYNRHLLHDMGSFQIGLGVAAFAALVWSDALMAVLAGTAVGAAFSGTAHILDWGLGGRPFDPVILYGVAALLLAALVARRTQLVRTGTPAPEPPAAARRR